MRKNPQPSLFAEAPARKANLARYHVGGEYLASEVFDTYWRFAVKRQNAFWAKQHGQVRLTTDPIIAQYKFTNAYRASDRVSQYLIREVIYRTKLSIEDTFFRVILFKLFNSISTWELLSAQIGEPMLRRYSFSEYDELLTSAIDSGKSIYSGAYIMPSGGRNSEGRKHRSHLRLLEAMLAAHLPRKIRSATGMGEVFALIKHFPMMGDFLSYQFAIDLNYSELTNFDEMDFVMPGPGAMDGIKKCFPDAPASAAIDIIKWVCNTQDDHFARLDLNFQYLGGRKLQLIDCQNLFCEVDKYSRVAHPEIAGLSGRLRIKQQYKPTISPVRLFYPPKWGINDKL